VDKYSYLHKNRQLSALCQKLPSCARPKPVSRGPLPQDRDNSNLDADMSDGVSEMDTDNGETGYDADEGHQDMGGLDADGGFTDGGHFDMSGVSDEWMLGRSTFWNTLPRRQMRWKSVRTP
jgi:hypothetical protein